MTRRALSRREILLTWEDLAASWARLMTRRALSRRVILLTWVDLAASWARLIGNLGCEISFFSSFLTIQMCSNQFCVQEFIFFFGLAEGQPQNIDI